MRIVLGTFSHKFTRPLIVYSELHSFQSQLLDCKIVPCKLGDTWVGGS